MAPPAISLSRVLASNLSEFLRLLDREGQAELEYRGRGLRGDCHGVHASFAMDDGLAGELSAAWPPGPLESEEGRAALVHAMNRLVQRCGMFEICERAYTRTYGRRTV